MHLLDRKTAYGVVFVLLIAGVIVATIASYRGAFQSTVPVEVHTDRAGLTLAHGAPVKYRGVQVGHVDTITTDGRSVVVRLAMNSGDVAEVPASVTAQIVPPTAFGGKYVQLTSGPPGSAEAVTTPMVSGDVIDATHVTVEVDDAFENLTQVLDAAHPAQVNQALSAVAGAVDGRGELIGSLISQTDTYLRSIDPSLQTLSADLGRTDDVVDTYARSEHDLVDTLANLGTTSQTLVQQQASLQALELSLTSFSGKADTFLALTRNGIVTTLTTVRPVTSVLARYSPELPCTILGLASVNKLAEAAVGGTNPGVTTISRLVPGRAPYSYPRNLPTLGEDRGPACYGLPYVSPGEAARPATSFDTGANPYATGTSTATRQDSLSALFGQLAARSTR
ncbi:MAG TPA: MCE family protein [Nocardioides sp.]|nr:MCE family protein [Nocardioides sp.]